MCCLFGLMDYGAVWKGKQKSKILSVLGKECEARGTDASGVSYVKQGELVIYKRPVPSRRMQYRIPKESRVVMGHTRLTTQGSEKRNINNHPFPGCTNGLTFALAHNGMLHNDHQLRREKYLPKTPIQTDSYVIVQLLEQSGTLQASSLKQAAEVLEGSFTFTVLDEHEVLHIVRGDNPFCLYQFEGFYLYASTEEILQRALKRLQLSKRKHQTIPLTCGDILEIQEDGTRHYAKFDTRKVISWLERAWYSPYELDASDDYTQKLMHFARQNGFEENIVQQLLALGYDESVIEEYLCYPSLFRAAWGDQRCGFE